ncbi:HPr family phosphocarrier protein [Cellulomonas hominis]
MPTRIVTIATPAGVHARPAGTLAREAAASPVPVTIARPGTAGVDLASVLQLMSLSLRHGEEIELSAEGEGADAVLDRLASLLATDLDAAVGA